VLPNLSLTTNLPIKETDTKPATVLSLNIILFQGRVSQCCAADTFISLSDSCQIIMDEFDSRSNILILSALAHAESDLVPSRDILHNYTAHR